LNYHLLKRLDAYGEYRQLWSSLSQDSEDGALAGFSYHLREHVQFGAGYNFTSFNDDLTRLNFRSHGPFINILGKW
jgi:hypothetical protein